MFTLNEFAVSFEYFVFWNSQPGSPIEKHWQHTVGLWTTCGSTYRQIFFFNKHHRWNFLLYHVLNDLFSSLFYWVNTVYNIYNTQNICNRRIMLQARLLVKSWLLVVTFWGVKSYMGIFNSKGSQCPHPCVVQRSTEIPLKIVWPFC